MKKYKLLVVEDDPNLGQILKEYLGFKGYQVSLANDGEKGLTVFEEDNFDLCILDIMLPKKDGFTLSREIRKTNDRVPFIFLTAKSMKEDTIEGLKLGADDYITKPFSMEELMLRLQAILKRVYPESRDEQNIFKFGHFIFYTEKQLLESDGSSIKLTTKESELLKLLCMNMNKTLNRRIALKAIWNDDSYFNARSMDVYITKLRKYIKDDQSTQILTLHGQGFKLVTSIPSNV